MNNEETILDPQAFADGLFDADTDDEDETEE